MKACISVVADSVSRESDGANKSMSNICQKRASQDWGQTILWHRGDAHDHWLWWALFRGQVTVHCYQEELDHISTRPTEAHRICLLIATKSQICTHGDRKHRITFSRVGGKKACALLVPAGVVGRVVGCGVVLAGALVIGDDLPCGALHRSLSQQVMMVPARPPWLVLIGLHSSVHARVIVSSVSDVVVITICNNSAKCETHEWQRTKERIWATHINQKLNELISECARLPERQQADHIGRFETKQDLVTQLSLINRATRLGVSQRHQTWYHSIC